MGNIFAASEIVEIGIQIEKNGKDFYENLSLKTKNLKAKDIFKFLASEEEKHIKTFQEILNSIEKYQPQGLDSDEYYAYMNALASESVFTQKDRGRELAENIKNDLQAIEIGIQAEKDSIIFYTAMKKVTSEYDQKAVDAVLAQEEAHLKKLVNLKENL
ncbi:MAG: ferritin family protein [Candidatus Omnitrophica bacterium]|nr:ferritin family protein [Candidatus Omnitrophota bacterium]